MAEHEDGLKKNPESQGKPPRRERPERRAAGSSGGGSEKPKPPAEAKDVDKSWDMREALFKEALEKVKEKGVVTKPEVADEKLKQLFAFLKKREKGEEIPEKERAGLWKLLLAILRTLWKEIQKLFKEQKYQELIAAARAAGAKTDAEVMLWLLGAKQLSKGESLELEGLLRGGVVEEAKPEGKPAEEVARPEQGGVVERPEKIPGPSEGPSEGMKGPSVEAAAEPEEEEGFTLGYLDSELAYAKARLGYVQREVQELSSEHAPVGHRAVRLLGGYIDQLEKYATQVDEILERHEVPSPEFLETLGREFKKEREQFRKDSEHAFKFLEPQRLYSPRFYEVLGKMKKLEYDGVFRRMRKPTERDGEVLTQAARDQQAERRQAKQSVDGIFNLIVSEAEVDPRQQFNFASEDWQLWGEFLEKVKSGGGMGYYYDYQGWWVARRLFHNLSVTMESGGDLEQLAKSAEIMGHSRDRSHIVRMEPGLGVALRLVEKETASTLFDPKNKGRLTFEALSLEGGPDSIVQSVSEELLKLSQAGRVFHSFEGDEGGRFPVTPDETEAKRLAALALKIANADMRTADYAAQGRLPERDELGHLYSPPFEKILTAMNPVRFLADRFDQYGDSLETMERLMSQMNAMLPAFFHGKQDELLLSKFSPENLFGFGSEWSSSFWRSLLATKALRERMDLALSVQLANAKHPDDFTDDKKEEKKEALEKRTKILEKVPQRMPSRTLSLLPSVAHDKDGRLQGVFFQGKAGEMEAFQKYAANRALADQDYDHDKEFIEKKAQYTKAERDRRLHERKQEEVFRQEGVRLPVWMIADELDPDHTKFDRPEEFTMKIGDTVEIGGEQKIIKTEKDLDEPRKEWAKQCEKWEKKVWDRWRETQKKLWRVEEAAVQGYYERIREEDGNGARPLDREKQEEYYEDFLIENLLNMKEVPGLLPDENFNDQEKALIGRLTAFGATDGGKRRDLAEQLAGMRFNYAPFLDDVLHEETDWGAGGPRMYARRFIDGMMAGKGAEGIFHLAAGLSGTREGSPQSREEFVKGLLEVKQALGHLGEGDRQKITASLAGVFLNDMYTADPWVEGKQLYALKKQLGPLGSILGFVGGFFLGPVGALRDIKIFNQSSSAAQRRFGKSGMSLSTAERWRFVQELRPYIGEDGAKTLEKLLHARKRDIVLSYLHQYSVPGLIFAGGTIVYDALKRGMADLQKYVLSE